MASHSDEEALGSLLDVDGPQRIRASRRRAPQALLGAALVAGLFAVGLWAMSGEREQQIPASVPLGRRSFEQKETIGQSGVLPEVAFRRNDQRERMIVEEDLQIILTVHVSRRQAHYRKPMAKDGAALCYRQAEHLFDEVIEESGLELELRNQERDPFKRRFASAMERRCKDLISERLWLKAAGEELEQQKPLVTAAMVAALNRADLGFKAEMHSWLVHESAATFSSRLGLLPTPRGQKSVLKRKHDHRNAEHLPRIFRADLKWPQCKDAILRIHNQGHCGSCWAFGGLASIDARMCIAANGTWDASNDVLSRLHATSCAPQIHNPGSDGCQGGWPHWPMEMMARSGVASSSCLPYYISGEGVEHFQHQDTAPPCETHCQGGYSLPLSDDKFSSAGIANYDWIVHVHGDPEKIARTKVAIYQEGPVAFAFKANSAFMGYKTGVFSVCTGHDQANHAVYTFGWGVVASADGGEQVEYFESTNSWGPDWGAHGHFRIHPRCITDVTIAGSIESSVVEHQVGIVDPNVPRDPDNEMWPWAAPDECPYVDGCITDLEGNGNYSNSELCVSDKLNGKRIRVVEFDLELSYDVLRVNGRAFSGTMGSDYTSDLNGLLVDEHGIKFQTDSSVVHSGFKLCQE